jgi:hypothetical protein
MPIPAGQDEAAWSPTPAQVHAVIPTRPTFTDTSRPSVAEVQDIIDLTADSVAAEARTNTFEDSLVGKVRYVVCLGVASQVEMAFFPEQQTGPDSPGQELYARYQAELIGLRTISATRRGAIVA